MNQSGVQAAIRAHTGTSLDYNSDWHALFDADGIATGDYNFRLLLWINATLGTSYAGLPQAMQAYAASQGFTSWSSMSTLLQPLALYCDEANADYVDDNGTPYGGV